MPSYARTEEPTVCACCRETKPSAAFHSRPSKLNGLQSHCKTCMRSAARKGFAPRVQRVLDGTVRCPRCSEYKSADLFWTSSSGRPTTYCTPCRRERQREHWLRREYGLSYSAFADLVAKQDGKCAICREVPDRELYVDHCHGSGSVRALLCHSCNVGLGNFVDSPVRLRAAAAYVEEYRG